MPSSEGGGRREFAGVGLGGGISKGNRETEKNVREKRKRGRQKRKREI
jgi:hypothetical protein